MANPDNPRLDSDLRLYALLRELDEEAQNLREALVRVVKAGDEPDEDKRGLALFSAIGTAAQLWNRNSSSILDRFRKIQTVFEAAPTTHEWYAREVAKIQNQWDWAYSTLSAINEHKPRAAALDAVRSAIASLDVMIFESAQITITAQLDHYLENVPIGKPIDFLEIMKDELPDLDGRKKVFHKLAVESKVVPGFLDLDACIILKASNNPKRQRKSLYRLLVATLLGFILLILFAHLGLWLGIDGWKAKPEHMRALAGGYTLILLGIVVHWLLDKIKQIRSGQNRIAFSEILLWIHVNEVQIPMRIVSACFLLIALVVMSIADPSKQTSVEFFLYGYFLDSVMDTLLGRIDGWSQEATRIVQKRLTPTVGEISAK